MSKIIISLDYIDEQIMINGWREESGKNLTKSISEFIVSLLGIPIL